MAQRIGTIFKAYLAQRRSTLDVAIAAARSQQLWEQAEALEASWELVREVNPTVYGHQSADKLRTTIKDKTRLLLVNVLEHSEQYTNTLGYMQAVKNEMQGMLYLLQGW